MRYFECYRFADVAVTISTLYEYTHRMAYDYRCEETPQLNIETNMADIEKERQIYIRQQMSNGANDCDDATDENLVPDEHQFEMNANLHVTDEYLEFLAVQRKLAEMLCDYDVCLCHGSAVSVDGKTLLLTGKSGAGKSTHALFCKAVFGSRCEIINDDKPFLRFFENGVRVYGSPWDGKHRRSCNGSGELIAVALIVQSNENKVEHLETSQIPVLLMQQVHMQVSREHKLKLMELIERLSKVDFYKINCTNEPNAAIVSGKAIWGESGNTFEEG